MHSLVSVKWWSNQQSPETLPVLTLLPLAMPSPGLGGTATFFLPSNSTRSSLSGCRC